MPWRFSKTDGKNGEHVFRAAPWLPQREGSRHEWLKTYKKGREAYKASVNESYKKVEDFLVNIEEKTGKTKASK